MCFQSDRESLSCRGTLSLALAGSSAREKVVVTLGIRHPGRIGHLVETSTFLSVFHCYVMLTNLPSPTCAVAMSLYQIIYIYTSKTEHTNRITCIKS